MHAKPDLIVTSPSLLGPRDERWLAGLSFAFISVLWLAFASEEPLHIDELRQLNGYWGGLASWLATSWELNQPPLEVTLGGLWRLAFGSTDYAERLLPTLFGLGSLGLLARLSHHFAGNTLAPTFTILTYGLSPIVFRTTAYIRPYAMPTFFALLFIVAVRHLLLKGAHRGPIALAVVAGAGLVLTHALVPVVVAILSLIGLVIRRIARDTEEPGMTGALWATSLTFVASLIMPVVTRLKNPTFFDVGVPYSFTDRVQDGAAALLSTYRVTFGLAGLALGLLLLVLLYKPFRPTTGEVWWFIPLLGISPGISLVYFMTVAPGFPFFERYFRDLMLAGAIALGLVASRVVLEWRRLPRAVALLAGAFLVVLYAIPTLIAMQSELTEQENTDWAQGSRIVMENTPVDSQILFEFMRPFPAYQPLFYGQPRYLPSWYQIRRSRDIVSYGHQFADGPAVVLLTGPTRVSVAPPGWRVIDDGSWRLLIPPAEAEEDPVALLETLDDAIADDRFDVYIRFSLAIELAREGSFDAAERVLSDISPPDVPDPQRRFDQIRDAALRQIEEIKASR